MLLALKAFFLAPFITCCYGLKPTNISIYNISSQLTTVATDPAVVEISNNNLTDFHKYQSYIVFIKILSI
jgi:hypothetical protein